jgi:hypothetical protein
LREDQETKEMAMVGERGRKAAVVKDEGEMKVGEWVGG